MLDRLTRESFEPRRGEIFMLSSVEESGGPRLELRLSEVQTNGRRGQAGREQFSLHFRGPREPLLPQMIYRLENPAAGILDLFLVAIGRDETGVMYEAVFT